MANMQQAAGGGGGALASGGGPGSLFQGAVTNPDGTTTTTVGADPSGSAQTSSAYDPTTNTYITTTVDPATGGWDVPCHMVFGWAGQGRGYGIWAPSSGYGTRSTSGGQPEAKHRSDCLVTDHL